MGLTDVGRSSLVSASRRTQLFCIQMCTLFTVTSHFHQRTHVMLSLFGSVKHFLSAARLLNTKLMLKKEKKIEYIDKQTTSSACENGLSRAPHSLGWTGGV